MYPPQLLINGGAHNLLVISDFDRTMTKAFIDGKVTALISIMVREHVFDDEYMEIMRVAYEQYRPIEIDETLPLPYRVQKMEEWWQITASTLIEKKLSKQKLTRAIAKAKHYLRDGVAEFLTILHQKNIPLLIFSGNSLGIESIKIFLELHDLDFANIHIYGNEFIWNEAGEAVDYKKPLVHVFNKDFQLVKSSDFFPQIRMRKNVLAIGDNISDLDMVKNCEYQNIHTVGFLNEKSIALNAAYTAAFDQVIKNDGTFEYLNSLLTKIN